MKFVGHRGASYALPELTMASITKALAVGISFECDLQVLRSGEVVLLHDDTLERTAAPWRADIGLEEEAYKTLVTTPTSSLSLDEVSRVDVGSWFDAAHREERVPPFAMALHALKQSPEASSLCCFAELKSVVEEEGGTGAMPEVDRQLVSAADSVARAHNLPPEQLVWISFSRAVAIEIKKRMPLHASLLIRCGARACWPVSATPHTAPPPPHELRARIHHAAPTTTATVPHAAGTCTRRRRRGRLRATASSMASTASTSTPTPTSSPPSWSSGSGGGTRWWPSGSSARPPPLTRPRCGRRCATWASTTSPRTCHPSWRNGAVALLHLRRPSRLLALYIII